MLENLLATIITINKNTALFNNVNASKDHYPQVLVQQVFHIHL
jgi:hypothetical protein